MSCGKNHDEELLREVVGDDKNDKKRKKNLTEEVEDVETWMEVWESTH